MNLQKFVCKEGSQCRFPPSKRRKMVVSAGLLVTGNSKRMSLVIAIDGPAASGKSSVGRKLAAKLHAVFVNSGAMYRAVTWAALRDGVAVSNAEAVAHWVQSLEISCLAQDGRSAIRIDGSDPEPHLRDPEVNAAVSILSAVPEVRRILVEKLRSYAALGPVVMEGRDIGSVVFPDTPHKFYIDASEEVRAARRRAQGETDSIASRDAQDSTRKTAPLTVAPDAVVVDSSNLSIDAVVGEIERHLARQGVHVC